MNENLGKTIKMKQKNIQRFVRKQAQNSIALLLTYDLTSAEIKVFRVIWRFIERFPKAFPKEATIASYAGVSLRTVSNCKKRLEEVGLITWTKNDPAATPTYSRGFRLLDVKFSQKLKSLLQIALGVFEFTIFQNPLWRGNCRLLVKGNNYINSSGAPGTPPPPPPETFAESYCKQYPVTEDPDSTKKTLTQEFWDSLFDMRPVGVGIVSRPGAEATTQKHQDVFLKQESSDGSIQPNTTVHSRDRRDSAYKVGTDQADGVPGSGDRRCPQSPKTQQSGWQSIRSLFQGSVGLLQSQQPGNTVEESRLPQGDIQYAGECPDDTVWGYEEAYAEVYD